MAFFQRPTDYPCQLILDPQNDYETLRQRVEQTTLKAQTVNRNRSGVTNVRAEEERQAGQTDGSDRPVRQTGRTERRVIQAGQRDGLER